MKLVLGGMMLILGFLFSGCCLSEAMVSLVVFCNKVEEEAIVSGKDGVKDNCECG